MIAAVRSVMQRVERRSGSRPSVSSTSANTGTAPAATTAFTVATNVKAGTITSSPQPTPKRRERAAQRRRSVRHGDRVRGSRAASHAARSKSATAPDS